MKLSIFDNWSNGKGSCVFKWRQGMGPVPNIKTYNPNCKSKHNVEQKR